jgi:Ser/Thr protein kinase RdoA (MazF antagonist)
MQRNAIIQICETQVLERAARLFGTSKNRLKKFEDYEGCANLVYQFEIGGQERILRISYNPARPLELIQAELHFIQHLAAGGLRVSEPILSLEGNLTEVIHAAGLPFIAVSFVKGRGKRVPDNQYRYRPNAPIEEYFQNWGSTLGRMHRLTKSYQPPSPAIQRPQWHELEAFFHLPNAERLPLVRQKFEQLIAELHALPKDRDSYGLIHNDFNDGNFTVDYDNGDITVFDFDDCVYFWFVYDLACAWEGGVGRTMFRPLDERRAFMDHYLQQVMKGYNRENSLSDEWLARLPLFLRLVQMQELHHFAQYLDDPDPELQAELRYKIRCIEEDIPYLGFFDRLYSPETPFALWQKDVA